MVAALRAGPRGHIEGVPEHLHEVPAMMRRSAWKELGRLVAAREEPAVLDGSKWVSLRLDGCLWGTLLGRLRAAGVVAERGYCAGLGEAMRACCRAVMDEFKATAAYTHSDEMTLLLAPRKALSDGRRLDFPYNGRVQKWVSIAASVATALFNRKLAALAAAHGVELDEKIVAHFDCRVGVFDSELEASALLLWRAYDCSVNCAQDACHHAGAGPGIVGGPFATKVRWLHDAGLLPMDPHQAYGSLFVKGTGEFGCSQPEADGTATVMRRVNVHVNDGANGMPRNLLNCLREGLSLLPQEGDPRMELRDGSFWRFAGPSGTGDETKREERRGPRRRRGQQS